jgi:hypothetical protein
LLTGINFSLTKFPDDCQTLENKESEFLEFTFLETNKAQISNQIDVAQFKKKRKETKSLHYITLETKREWAQFTVKYVWGYSEIHSFETWPSGLIQS